MRTVACVLVAAVAAGCSGGPSGTPAATQTAPSATPAVATTPAASEVAPGIAAWTKYTSAVYGITFGYPDGWTLDSAATRPWQVGDQHSDSAENSDYFINPESRDGDQISLAVRQRAAGPGADSTSREGLAAWFEANQCNEQIDACKTVSDLAVPMCVGKVDCLPAVLVPLSDSTQAVFADPETDLVTVVSIGRPDDFPAAARYGGAVQLLKSILTQMDVWTPEPGQISASDPNDTSAWLPFVSERYGFSMAYPPSWSAHPANGEWNFPEDTAWPDGVEAADWFYLDGPDGSVAASAWSVALARGTSADQWFVDYCAVEVTPCERTDPKVPASLDGHAGWFVAGSDPQAYFGIGDRIYLVVIWQPEDHPSLEAYGGGRQLVETFLSTMHLLEH
jgi:hypothetical protein